MNLALPPGVKLIQGQQAGPALGVMAIMHGDEPAGLAALDFLEDYFTEHPLEKGSLFLILGNMEARDLNRRFVKQDMNRLFLSEIKGTDIDPNTDDYRRAKQLKPFLAQLDFLLDLHSTSKPSVAFSATFSHNDIKLMMSLPTEYYTHGWNGHVTGTAVEWVQDHGGVGIIVECGQHGDSIASTNAINSTKAFLNYTGMTDFELNFPQCTKDLTIFKVEKVTDPRTYDYTHDFVNFDLVNPGEVIARETDRVYQAPDEEDIVIILPASTQSIRDRINVDAYFLAKCETMTT